MDIPSKTKITALVLQEFARSANQRYVPVAVSNRHVHLCIKDIETLFGKGYQLNFIKDLVQPGQFVTKEVVTLTGPKGSIENVRVLGPARDKTQIEISITDSYKLGIEPMVRMSGDTERTPGCKISTQSAVVKAEQGVIVSARHLHISPEQAKDFKLSDGQKIKLQSEGIRTTLFENVIVRCGAGHFLEVHLDMDEANASGIRSGDFLKIVT